ncbi:hypothetical protein ACQ4LE_010220 [Meloidogyne hapla]|uniref:W2 domain-containing protein n=1 Tax=Meloidogyne hapla TaxID=6305 RepID=A0A1I8BH03_MELHA
MLFAVASKKFCLPKILTSVGSIRGLNDLATIIDTLANNFKIVKPRFTIDISDPKLIGLPAQAQKDSVMQHVPKDQKFVLDRSELVFNILCTYYETDTELTRVQLRKHVEDLPDIDDTLQTPQSLLDEAVFHIEKLQGAIACDLAWLASSRQLKNYLRMNEVDINSHMVKSKVVEYLFASCTDENLAPLISSTWDTLERGHANSYKNDYGLKKVGQVLVAAELFCNIICDLHEKKPFKSSIDLNDQKSFNRDDLLKWLRPNNMIEMEIPIANSNGIMEWESIIKWVATKKISKEEVKKKWINKEVLPDEKFNKWMKERIKDFNQAKEREEERKREAQMLKEQNFET